MTYGEFKQITYSLIEEYESTAADFTDDDDIVARMPFLSDTAIQEMAQIKKIIKTHELDRTAIGTSEYYREYDLNSLISDLYQVRGIYKRDESTNKRDDECKYELTGDNILVINDTEDGNFKIEYNAFPLTINEDTDDDDNIVLSKDAAIIAAYKVADIILVTDVSANYTAFRQEFDRRMSIFDNRSQANVVSFGTQASLEE